MRASVPVFGTSRAAACKSADTNAHREERDDFRRFGFVSGSGLALSSGWVLRTAWANISRILSLLIGWGRTYFVGSVMG